MDMMLFLLFQIGDDRYALDARRVAAVLPLVRLKQIPGTPAAVAGIFNYHGVHVPVVDMSMLALSRPARQSLGTRIILVHYPDQQHLLGIIAEKATETLRSDAAAFQPYGLGNDAAPYLGPVMQDTRGLIQWVEIDQLLSDEVREQLFPMGAIT